MEFECILGHRWTGDEDDEWTDGERTLPVCPTCSSDGFRATAPLEEAAWLPAIAVWYDPHALRRGDPLIDTAHRQSSPKKGGRVICGERIPGEGVQRVIRVESLTMLTQPYRRCERGCWA